MNTGGGKESPLTRVLTGLQDPKSIVDFLEAAFDAVVAFDRQERITYWNPAAEQMFGWTAQEAVGKTPAKLFWPLKTLEEKKSHTQRQLSLKRGATLWGECHLYRKDGSTVWIQYMMRAIFDAEGKRTGYLALYRDISVQMRLHEKEEQLKRSNQKLNDILESIQDDFYVIDPAWNFLFASRSFTSKIGKEPQDFVGNNIWQMFPKHVGTVLEENFRAAMEKGEIRTFEIPGKYTDAWYRMKAFPSSEGITVLGTDITERKRAEEALRVSQLRYRTVADNTQDFECWISPEGKYLYASPSCKRIYGRDASEFLTKPALRRQIVYPDDQAAFDQHLTQEASRLMGETEFRIVRPDGTVRWISHMCQPVFDESGNYLGVRESNRDITERKKMEEALRESEERYRHLVKYAPAAIYEIDVKTMHFMEVNDIMCQMLGYTRQELLSKMPEELLDEESRGRFRERVARTLAGEKVSEQIEYKIRAKDGHDLWSVLNTTINYDHGEPRSVSVIAHDITKRKRAEAVLRESEERFRTMANNLPFPVWVTNAHGEIEMVNRTYEEFFGVKEEQVLPPNGWQPLLHPDDQDAYVSTYFKSIQEQTPFSAEARVKRADGEWRWIASQGTVRFDGNGEFLGHVGSSPDITERKRSEEQLRELSQRLTYHVDNSPLAVIEWGSDMRLIRWSGAAERIFGWKAEEVLGHRIEDFRWVYDEDMQQVNNVSIDLQTGINPRRFSANRNYRKDGSVAYCEWYNSSLIDEAGNLRSILSLVLDVTERKRAEEALYESQKALQLLNQSLEQKVNEKTAAVRRLASELVEATQNERQRISQILHDDLQQRVYAVRMQLTLLSNILGAESEEAQAQASDIERQLGEIVQVIRHLSIDISPPISHAKGLSSALEWLAGQMQQQHGLNIELQSNEAIFVPDEKLHLLLVNGVRELLFNVVKHADARQAVIVLQRADTTLFIEVRDDGKGFPIDPSGEQSSFGLPTLRHQLSLFGGELEIHSEPNVGTRIMLKVPLSELNTES